MFAASTGFGPSSFFFTGGFAAGPQLRPLRRIFRGHYASFRGFDLRVFLGVG